MGVLDARQEVRCWITSQGQGQGMPHANEVFRCIIFGPLPLRRHQTHLPGSCFIRDRRCNAGCRHIRSRLGALRRGDSPGRDTIICD
jgi:hypothetical protein